MAIAYVDAGTRTAANASSHNVAYPATVNAGDLLVLHVTTNGPSVTGASGWTEVYNETVLSNPKGGIWYQVAAGTEGGTTTTITLSGAAATGAQIFRFTGVDGTTPLDGTPTNVTNSTTGNTTILPSITTSTTDTMLVYCNAGNSSSTTMSSTTGTELVDHGELGSAKSGALYYEPVSASGATGTRTIDLAANRANWGAMLALRAAATTVEGNVTAVAATGTTAAVVPVVEGLVAGDIVSPAATVSTLAYIADVSGGSGAGQIELQGTPTLGEGDSLATDVTVPYPSGIQAGELLVAHIAYSQEYIDTTAPSGWTLHADHQNTTANTMSQAVWYRVADGSETGSVTFPGDTGINDGRITGRMARWSGVDTTTPFDVANVEAGEGNSTSIVMPSITTVTDGAVLIHQLSQNSTVPGISTSSGTTKFGTNVTGTGRDMGTYYELRATAGATGTRTWNSTNSVQWGGITVALRPAPASSPGNVSAVVATTSVLAPIPVVAGNASTVLPAATGSTLALAAVVTAGGGVVSPAGAVTIAAPAPVVAVGAGASSPAAAATVAAVPPVVTAAATVTAVAPSASGAALAPVVSGAAGATAPAATATAAAQSLVVTGAAAVTMPVSTVAVTAPGAGIPAYVTAPLAQATVLAPAPTAAGGATVAIPLSNIAVGIFAPQVVAGTQAVVANVNIAARAPNVGGSGTYVSPAATVSALARVPSVTAGFGPPRAVITASALVPTVSGGTGAVVVTATASAAALPPSFTVIATVPAVRGIVTGLAVVPVVTAARTTQVPAAAVTTAAGTPIAWVPVPEAGPSHIGAKQFTRTATLTLTGTPGPAASLTITRTITRSATGSPQAGANMTLSRTQKFQGGNASTPTTSGALGIIRPHTITVTQAGMALTADLTLSSINISNNLLGTPNFDGALGLELFSSLGLSGLASIPGQLVLRRCEKHTAFVYDRGGRRQIGSLGNLALVRYSRKRDDMSDAYVVVQSPSKQCADMLELVESARHELVIFRGNVRVWEGPILRAAFRGDRAEIFANDIMWYVMRTIMKNEYDNRYPNNGPVLERIQRIMTAEVARKEAVDPPYNILQHVQYIRATAPVEDAGTAAHTLPYELNVYEHIDTYAARGGIDYTTVGRSILFFDVHTAIGQTPMVTRDDFIGDPIVTQYGSEVATEVAMTDGKGNHGSAGGDDPYYGNIEVLHQAYDETAGPVESNQPPSVAEMTSQAKRALSAAKVAPAVVRVPDGTTLNPNGVLDITMLVPGVHIPLHAKLPGRSVTQMQKLDSMTVEETPENGEVIQVTLSPATSESFVEDDV